jgi:hypothetical protein
VLLNLTSEYSSPESEQGPSILAWEDHSDQNLGTIFVRTMAPAVCIPELCTTVNRLCVYNAPCQDDQDPLDQVGEREVESPSPYANAMTVHHLHFDQWPDYGVPSGSAREAVVLLAMTTEKLRETLGWPEKICHW